MYLNVSETVNIKCTSGHILGTLGTFSLPLAHGVHLSMYDDHVCCKDMYSEIWVHLRYPDTFYLVFQVLLGIVCILSVHHVQFRYCRYIQGTLGTFWVPKHILGIFRVHQVHFRILWVHTGVYSIDVHILMYQFGHVSDSGQLLYKIGSLILCLSLYPKNV